MVCFRPGVSKVRPLEKISASPLLGSFPIYSYIAYDEENLVVVDMYFLRFFLFFTATNPNVAGFKPRGPIYRPLFSSQDQDFSANVEECSL